MESLKSKLGNLSCHFTWEEVIGYESYRESHLSTTDFHEGDDDDGSISEVHWRNLKGYYKCKDNDFEEARKCFEIALKKCSSEEEKTVTLSCMAWLFYEEAEKSSDDETKETLQGKSNDMIEEVISILKGREMENLPEVLFERASVAIHVGGNKFGRFEEANRLIDKALEGKPEALIYKFTKAKNKQKFLFHRKIAILGDENNEVNELDQLWKELIEMKSSSTDLHAEILVCYAFFLNRKYGDFGKTASPYALKAGKLGAENPYVLRKVAQFYVNSARVNDVTKLEKAIKILKELLQKNTKCYKTQSALGKVLYRKYSNFEGSPYSSEKLFRNAEENLTKSWEANPKYSIPAMDLVCLYQIKYDRTRQTTALIQAEKVFQQMFDSIEHLNVSFKGGLCHLYGHFLKNYGAVLASHHKNCHSTVLPAGPELMMRITEALKSADKFEENQDHCELHKAETIFLSLYNEVYDKDNNVQMTFYHQYTWEYSCFMEKYYKDLAMLYFIRSLNYNPHQTSVTTYDVLETLANKKARNVNEKGRFNVLVVLIWLYQMKYQTTKQEEYRLKAEDISKEAVKLKADEKIAKVLDKLSSLRMN